MDEWLKKSYVSLDSLCESINFFNVGLLLSVPMVEEYIKPPTSILILSPIISSHITFFIVYAKRILLKVQYPPSSLQPYSQDRKIHHQSL